MGGAWGARFAARGYRVNIQDPAPGGERAIRASVGRAAAALDVAPGVIHARLRFANDLESALAGVVFVQESAPESVDLKRQLLRDIDRLSAPEAIIASSTSDFPISLFQPGCRHPDRLPVGHPINPPYAAIGRAPGRE